MHNLLMLLTATLPCKTIPIGGEDYLERYYINTDLDGVQHWLHRFLRNDSERHLHSHPWIAKSTVIHGSYVEQRPDGFRQLDAGDSNDIEPDTLHRIIKVLPNTWTYMRVQPGRRDEWYFIDDDGNRKAMRASEPEWWRNYPCRGAA